MKLKSVLFVLFALSFFSIILSLLTNTQVNILSSQLTTLNRQLVELEIEKESTSNIFQEKYSIKNIDELSKSYNFVRLDVFTIKSDLIPPYKILDKNIEVDILSYFGK
ncbi:MAG: hypothetical protein O3A48_00210 [Actinomycetota bacterium]|nr:hypothetical protein [Actinomycetota bacterium]MDA3012952.1 hypothetical protein [Actinomycetota bacterium]